MASYSKIDRQISEVPLNKCNTTILRFRIVRDDRLVLRTLEDLCTDILAEKIVGFEFVTGLILKILEYPINRQMRSINRHGQPINRKVETYKLGGRSIGHLTRSIGFCNSIKIGFSHQKP